MFKKRLFALLLAAGLFALPFAGCGETQTPPEGETSGEQTPGEQTPGDKEPDDKEPDDKEPDDKEPDDKEPEEKEPEEKEPEEAVFTLSVAESYRLATVEGAETAEIGAVLERNGEAFDGEIVYTFSDAGIVSAADGKLTALAAGNTTLTATYTPEKGDPVTDTAAVEVFAGTTAESVNALEEESVNLLGRTYLSAKRLQLDNPCTGFEVAFFGTELTVKFYRGESYVAVFLDGAAEGKTVATTKDSAIKVAENLEKGIHVVRVVKAVGPSFRSIQLDPSPLETDGTFLKPPAKPDLKIEFIGDSITAGIGASGTPAQTSPTKENSNSTYSYAYLTAQGLNAEYSIIALSGICVKDGATNMYDRYQKNGFSTNTDYDFTRFDPDVVVLALGENDMWHATSNQFPDYNVDLFRKDYADMLRLIREKRPNAHIVCVSGMMNASSSLQADQTIKGAIKDTGDENITHIKMTPNTAGAHSHPSAEAHRANADKLIAHIRSLFDKETV